MPYLKVIALPHPRKLPKIAKKTIITNRYFIEQSIDIAYTEFCWPTVKNIEVISHF